MMSWSIDKFLKEMPSDHIGIMDLVGESKKVSTIQNLRKKSNYKDTPHVDKDE